MTTHILTVLIGLLQTRISIAQYTSAASLLPSSIKRQPNLAIALSHLDGFESNGALRKLLWQ